MTDEKFVPEHWIPRIKRNVRDLFDNHYTGLEGVVAEIAERAYTFDADHGGNHVMLIDPESGYLLFGIPGKSDGYEGYHDVTLYKLKPGAVPAFEKEVKLSPEEWAEYSERVLEAFGPDEEEE